TVEVPPGLGDKVVEGARLATGFSHQAVVAGGGGQHVAAGGADRLVNPLEIVLEVLGDDALPVTDRSDPAASVNGLVEIIGIAVPFALERTSEAVLPIRRPPFEKHRGIGAVEME